MATPDEARLLRRSIGYDPTDTVNFTQAEADQLYTDVTTLYPDSLTLGEKLPLAVVMYLEELLVNTAKLYTYRQNQTQNNVSDIFQHVKDLITYWTEKSRIAALLVQNLEGTVRSGKQKQIPTRWKEYPDS